MKFYYIKCIDLNNVEFVFPDSFSDNIAKVKMLERGIKKEMYLSLDIKEINIYTEQLLSLIVLSDSSLQQKLTNKL